MRHERNAGSFSSNGDEKAEGAAMPARSVLTSHLVHDRIRRGLADPGSRHRGRSRLRTSLPAMVLVLVAACSAPSAAPARPGVEGGLGVVAGVSARLLPSVVKIITPGGNGSGVVYTADGLILTNEHVVAGATALQVAFADGQRVAGTVRAVDVTTDLALVQVQRSGLPLVRFQPELPAVGELAIVIGSPLGFENSVTAGVVSGLHREIPGSALVSAALVDLIQTDAPISPGNSGGVLLDADGDVIGISEAYIPPQAGAVALGFAIPAATAIDVADQLRRTGRAQHAFAGIEPARITPEIAAQLRLATAEGVIVAGVVPAGPAAAAGLKPGDVITAVDGAATRTPEDFLGALRRRAPGDRITVTVQSPGAAPRQASITLTDRPAVSE